MANGYYGEDWDELESLIRPSDAILEKFALEKDILLEKNGKAPGYRGYRWETDIGRLLEIFIESYEYRTWRMGITAYEDRPEGRFWKTKTLFMPATISSLEPKLEGLLEEGWRTVTSWKSKDLYGAD
jgi:hypothetical protein